MNRRQRREMTRQWQGMFAQWRDASKKYANGDPWNTIETFAMYEGIDDKPADVIIAADILEHLPDIDKALLEIKGLAKKNAGFFIKLDAMRNAESWKAIIGKYFCVSEATELMAGHIWIAGSNTSTFGYGHVVGASTEEERWNHAEVNCGAFPKRITKIPPHDRKAILACYGPSLKEYLPCLKSELSEGGDLISVSGSHDFLIGHGVIPQFHVECDPRQHKADNIVRGHEGIKYLMGSIVHPILMSKLLDCDVTLWHPSSELNFKIKDKLDPDAMFIGGGGNVGLRSLVLFHELGYRDFSIYGMDCSFSNGEKWAGAHAQKQNQKEQKIIEVMCNGKMFTTSPVYITYANGFFDTVKQYPGIEFRIFGDSLLQAMSIDYMAQGQAA